MYTQYKKNESKFECIAFDLGRLSYRDSNIIGSATKNFSLNHHSHKLSSFILLYSLSLHLGCSLFTAAVLNIIFNEFLKRGSVITI